MSQSCCNPGSGCCAEPPKGFETVSASLSIKDVLGGWKARWGIERMNYRVDPGLYAVGNPDGDSPVLVSANYKLTFDMLRKNLSGLDCWLLILDTKGVNVWCAAGKGTFGTDELVNRIEAVGLSDIVSHKKLILPQLGASGVSAHEVQRRTGFSILYGPVRARDIKAFIASDFRATREMRQVRFTFKDRLVLTPLEFVETSKKSIIIYGVLFLLNLFAAKPFGLNDFILHEGAVLVGTVLTPILLPVVPVRAFSLKGWILGSCWTAPALWLVGWFGPGTWLLAAGYLLLLPSLAAYLAMNFTGCSTYTSPSGVLKEMKIALPPIIGTSVIGMVLILIHRLIG